MTLIRHPLDTLNNHQYMSLTTFRKSGERVPTPVWFVREGDRVVLLTGANSGKVKRIRNNPHVEIAPCDARGNLKGASIKASARILSPEEGKAVNAAIAKKYGLLKRLFDLAQWGRPRDFVEVIAIV